MSGAGRRAARLPDSKSWFAHAWFLCVCVCVVLRAADFTDLGRGCLGGVYMNQDEDSQVWGACSSARIACVHACA